MEQNPKIEIIPPPTNAPIRPTIDTNGEIDNLNFHLTKKKQKTKLSSDLLSSSTSTTDHPYTESWFFFCYCCYLCF